MEPSGLSGLPQTGSLVYGITQSLLLKASGSLVLSVAGMYFLVTGRKNQSLNSMLCGGALILLSLLLF